MTDRQLIAEFILQQIKANDLVEIVLIDQKIIRGYVLDKDVFKNKSLDTHLKEKLYPYLSSDHRSRITLQPLEEKDEMIEKLKISALINFNLLPKPPKEIYTDQIISIKKIDQ